MVAQLAVELRGLRVSDGEDPPRNLHLNPRLQGEWSQRPVLKENTFFRMQWVKGTALRRHPYKDDPLQPMLSHRSTQPSHILCLFLSGSGGHNEDIVSGSNHGTGGGGAWKGRESLLGIPPCRRCGLGWMTMLEARGVATHM
ncbi:hypothetical protein ACQ4PT_072025 [Festuca glaucescens]